MTAKEKAKELIDKFSPLAKNWDCYNDEPLEENNAKQCAIIALDEIMKIFSEFNPWGGLDYWYKVKQEIEKL